MRIPTKVEVVLTESDIEILIRELKPIISAYSKVPTQTASFKSTKLQNIIIKLQAAN
jgi:hypothetical protein